MAQCGLYPWQCTGSGACSLCNRSVNEIARGMMLAARKLSREIGRMLKAPYVGPSRKISVIEDVRSFGLKLRREAAGMQAKLPGGQAAADKARIQELEDALREAIQCLPGNIVKERLQEVLHVK